MIAKEQTVSAVVAAHPEVASVLTAAGLHCIGCHVSEFESIEEGCMGHGMTKQQIEDLIVAANAKVAEHEKKPVLEFTPGALEELAKRLVKENKKFVRLVQTFGEFDFEGTNEKEKNDVSIPAKAKQSAFEIVIQPNIERLLRGIKIDFDAKKKDFDAARVA